MSTIMLDDTNETAEVRDAQNVVLYANHDSRDALVAANAFLAVLADGANNIDMAFRIEKVMRHLSDMLYGFERE